MRKQCRPGPAWQQEGIGDGSDQVMTEACHQVRRVGASHPSLGRQ